MTLDEQHPTDDVVEPLGPPSPAPWQEGGDQGVDTEGQDDEPIEAPPSPLTDDELAGILGVVVEAPFDWTGSILAARAPEPVRAPIRALWPLAADESARIARRLAAAVPDRWRSSRILASSPLLIAAADVGVAFRARMTATQELVAAYHGAASERPGATPATEDTPDDAPPPGSLRERARRATNGAPAAGGAGRRARRPARAVPGESTA